MKTIESFCDEWLNAWTGNQPEKLLSFYHTDIFYLDPANTKGIQGKKALGTYLAKLLAKFPDWSWKRDELMSTEKGFTLKWKALVNGREFYGLDIVELRDQKIIRNEVFFDLTNLT